MSVQHTDVASYALGLLEEEDRQGFEAHLAECASCTAELAEFSAMADLFTGVEPVEVVQAEPPAEAAIAGLIAARAAARRRGVRRQVILAVAASVVLLAAGVTAGIAAAPPQTPQVGQPIPGQRVSATDPGTGVTATVGLVPSPGDGIPGHPGHLVIHGGTAIPEKQLASLAVIVVHGSTLVNIPVR